MGGRTRVGGIFLIAVSTGGSAPPQEAGRNARSASCEEWDTSPNMYTYALSRMSNWELPLDLSVIFPASGRVEFSNLRSISNSLSTQTIRYHRSR